MERRDTKTADFRYLLNMNLKVCTADTGTSHAKCVHLCVIPRLEYVVGLSKETLNPIRNSKMPLENSKQNFLSLYQLYCDRFQQSLDTILKFKRQHKVFPSIRRWWHLSSCTLIEHIWGIWGSQDGDYEIYCPLICDAVYSGMSLQSLQRNLLPSCLG
jgi:hypothetical protein